MMVLVSWRLNSENMLLARCAVHDTISLSTKWHTNSFKPLMILYSSTVLARSNLWCYFTCVGVNSKWRSHVHENKRHNIQFFNSQAMSITHPFLSCTANGIYYLFKYWPSMTEGLFLSSLYTLRWAHHSGIQPRHNILFVLISIFMWT